MRLLILASLLLATPGAVAAAQTGPLTFSANSILPVALPSARLRDWNPGDGRKQVTVASDGITLRGYDYAAPAPGEPTVLFFGGNAGTIEAADLRLRAIAECGARLVAYDYRGYGFSGGTADVDAFRRDALRLYDAVAVPGSPKVVVVGFSMGTAIAAYVASERKVAGLVLIAPISSARDIFSAYVKAMDPGVDPARIRTTPGADADLGGTVMVAKSSAPLLVVHGDADDTVPYAEGKAVFNASASPKKTFITLPGELHNSALNNPKTLEALETFFASIR